MSPIIIPAPGGGGGGGGGIPQSEYRQIYYRTNRLQALAAGGIYIPGAGQSPNLASGAAGGNPTALYLDDAEWVGSGLSPKLDLRAGLWVAGTAAPAINFVFGLYPVTAVSGAVATGTDLTLGAVLAGSTVTYNTPALNAMAPWISSGDFAFPADGWYVVGINLSAAMAANSNVTVHIELRVHLT